MKVKYKVHIPDTGVHPTQRQFIKRASNGRFSRCIYVLEQSPDGNPYDLCCGNPIHEGLNENSFCRDHMMMVNGAVDMPKISRSSKSQDENKHRKLLRDKLKGNI